jgi:hypothetical protein
MSTRYVGALMLVSIVPPSSWICQSAPGAGRHSVELEVGDGAGADGDGAGAEGDGAGAGGDADGEGAGFVGDGEGAGAGAVADGDGAGAVADGDGAGEGVEPAAAMTVKLWVTD